MATFSLSGNTPGAPGVYINERAGASASAAVASFSTVYMLVEAPESAPVQVFPFNTPVPVTSLADYRVLVGGSVPTDRIPLLSYNCVNEFFQNAQVGDLRVVRVGTPNSIVEVEFFPSASKSSSSSLPSALMAGDKVYVQMILNGTRLVAGDGSTGYTASGEWLGVPVVIPVNYVAGDEANNRKIALAISTAVAEAIESNPSVRTSVYVRSFGLVNDVDPASNSQNGFVSIAGTTFDSSVTVVTKSEPVSGTSAFTQNAYDVQNVNGLQADAVRVPQDYIQCIETAFDGQQDQGYLVTPTAYAQFDSAGRASVGAKAAAHCEDNNYKWMALADPGPFLVTDLNKYASYVPHQAAADLIQGLKYLVDNAIYEWTGDSVTFSRLDYQAIVGGSSPKIGIQESTNSNLAPDVKVGLLDRGEYTIYAPLAAGSNGRLNIDLNAYWPVGMEIQEIVLSGAGDSTNPFNTLQGNLFVVAPPYDTNLSGSYPKNVVFLAQTSTAAVAVYNTVVALGGSSQVTSLPAGAINVAVSANGVQSATISYAAPAYDLPVTINGQTSNLVQNIRSRAHGVNTQHLPGTLQDPTTTFVLGMFNRSFLNPSASIASGTNSSAVLTCVAHGLTDGIKVFFTAPILTASGFFLFKSSTKAALNPYYVKVLSADTFVLASSATNFAAGSYVKVPSSDPVATTTPVIAYSSILAAAEGSVQLNEAGTFPLVRGRKYAFDSSTVNNQASPAAALPVSSAANPALSIFLSKSSTVLGEGTVAPYGETVDASWMPELELLEPAVGNTTLTTLYGNNGAVSSIAPQFVTRDANGKATAIAMTSGGDLLPGSQGFWNVEGEAVMFLPPVWVEDALDAGAVLTWQWRLNGALVAGTANEQGVILGVDIPGIADGNTVDVAWTLTPPVGVAITGNTQDTPALLTYATFSGLGYNLAGNTQAAVSSYTSPWVVGRTVTFSAATLNATSATPTLPTGFNTSLKSYAGVTLFSAGSSSNAAAQLSVSTNGTYVSVDSAFVIGANTVVCRVQSYGPVGPLQANALCDWANGAPTNSAWSVSLTSINVANAGAQNFFCVPTVSQDFATESYLVPSTLIAGGTYNGTLVQTPTVTAYTTAAGLSVGGAAPTSQAALALLNGVYLEVTVAGTVPGGAATVVIGDKVVVYNDNGVYSWVVVNAGEDLTAYEVPLYGSQATFTYTSQVTPPISFWRFDAVTSTEIIDGALRGVGTNGVPQALFIEAGVDNVNRLYEDSQRYFNPFGFIAFYGSYILNASGQYIPPTPYVTGVAVRRYRAEGYQFPPAGVKYQLADAVGVQIPINSAQQNLLNPDGCNAVRTLPGYPQTAVFIWGGRTRVNAADAQQRLYQFVNTRVIMNVVYGSLRNAFDTQIFNVIDGFGVVFNQIVSVGNSVLNQLYVKGALFGARPSDAFQVICDGRINTSENLENGIVNAKVFVTPVPTLERIQIDLIRVAIGNMQNELNVQGLGQNNN